MMMSDEFTPALNEKPADIPEEYRQGALLPEFVSLMQKLADARKELREADARRSAAEDAAWARVAGRLHDAASAAGAATEAVPARELRRRVRAMREQLDNLWREQGIEFIAATGKRFEGPLAGDFEVLSIRPANGAEEDGTIVETWQPAIRRQGRLVRTGQVVVALRQPNPEENSR